MKKILAALLFSFPFCSYAEVFAMNFDRIPLVSFAEATYRNMLKRDYIFSSDLIAMEKPISVHVRNIDASALPKLIERILADQHIKSVEKDGVFFLSLDSSMNLNADISKQFRYDSSDLSSPLLAEKSAADGVQLEERIVYYPLNRKSDFIATAINTIFSSKSAVVAGGALVLSAPKSQIHKLSDLTRQIDVAPRKVRISASFLEVSSSASSGLGVSVIANVLGAKFGVKIGDVSSGSLSIGNQSFQAVLDVLSNDGRFKQVSNPSSVVDDYDKANISFGDNVPTVAGNALDKNGNPNQQIVYQASGVILDVTPRVLGSGKINITIDGQVSSFSATTTGVTSSPTLSKRQVQTSLTLDDGELLVIGGLNSKKTVNNTSVFPFFPKSWSAHAESDSSTDLLLILSATVVK